MLALDPTQRGLSTAEQFTRSTKLLDLERNAVLPCLGAASGELSDLIQSTEKNLKQRVPVARQGPAMEANLDLAGKLWNARPQNCATAPQNAGEEAVPLVLERLEQ